MGQLLHRNRLCPAVCYNKEVRKEPALSDEILTDNQGNPVYLSEVMDGWYDTRQAAYRMGMTTNGVLRRLKQKTIRAVQIGSTWYISPEATKGYRPGKHLTPKD